MSQFKGSKLTVRCVDCTKFSGSHCITKDVKVVPKKKRLCSFYDFKGNYENRIPAEAVYLPHVDKKTRRMLKRLIKQDTLPINEDGSVQFQEGFARTKSLPMPVSTATVPLPEVKTNKDSGVYEPSESNITNSDFNQASNHEYAEE